MLQKILFWVDAGLWDFCIAKSLQEKFECEISAIIDINKGRHFFENQQIVQFKNIKFYRDHIIGDSKSPDLEYLKKFESKYRINIWKIVYSDIIFNEYNKFYRYNSNETLLIVEKICKFFENSLDELKPDFLIIRMTDFFHLEILQKMCKSRGINVITFGDTRLGYRCMITSQTDIPDDINQMKNFLDYKKRTFEELQEFVKGYAKQQGTLKKKYKTSLKKRMNASLEFLKTTNKEYRKYYFNYGRNVFNVFKVEFKNIIKKQIRQKFIEKNLLKKIDNEKFIYFPLAFEPERTTLLASPFYTNQLDVITNIAKSLPVGYWLYVKEHPIQVAENWREISFYKYIKNLPNVKLIHPSIPNNEVIKKCKLVVTVTGTSGLEAAIYEKPSIVFADVTFSELDSVYRVKNIEDLPKIIREWSEKKVDIEKLNQFIGFLEKNSFELDMTQLYIDTDHYFYFGGFLKDVKIKQSDMKDFLKMHKKEFDTISLEYIKKIKRYMENKTEVLDEKINHLNT